jgi:large subunit ribosomal protein L24
MQKLKVKDEVLVIAGKSKGKTGKILKIFKEKSRVLVEGINLVKKHVKANPNTNEAGGIKSQERPISISNVAIFNRATKKRDKVFIKQLEDGSRVRCFKSSGEVVDV